VTHSTATPNKTQATRLGPRLLAMVMATLGLVFLLGAGTASAVVIRSQVESFGPDGTVASSFAGIRDLAFNQATRGLYAVERNKDASGIYGFDVSALPIHAPLAGYSPLSTVVTGFDPGVAVDNTALPSAGNVYFASDSTKLVYGFDKTGAPLGGNFPINPAITPGAPFGSPAVLNGAGVDSAGNVWIADYSTQHILEYSSAGVYKGSVSTVAQGYYPGSVAFDSNDDMYVTNGGDSTDATYRYTAASGYAVGTLFNANSVRNNAVDRLSHHVFLVGRPSSAVINEYDSTGSLISTTSENDSTGDMIIPTPKGLAGASFRGIAVDSANNRVFAADDGKAKIRVFGDPQTYPDLTLGTASGIANTSATVSGTISAQGVALSDCHFEYVTEAGFSASGFDDLSSGGTVPCSPAAGSIPVDSAAHPVTGSLSGLTANTSYLFRLVAANANGPIATLSGDPFETPGPSFAETMGSPVRTTTTARLDGRVNPKRAAATYHFEYGEQGPCDSNPCTSTESHPAGSGNEFELVSQQIEGLQPSTTYHYRVIADNGNPDGVAIGSDMTVTTRGDEAPLSHGHLPGPPGSDRAWELVSAPDTGGNPVGGVGLARGASAISDAGDRAVYGVAGGTPDSVAGTASTNLLAERTPTGWQTRRIFPGRGEATGPSWAEPGGPSDLSTVVTENDPGSGSGERSVWRLAPSSDPVKLFAAPDRTSRGGFLGVSDDGSRVLLTLKGTEDPAHPVPVGSVNLYDISSGPAQLISLLPDGTVPPCGVAHGSTAGPGFPDNPADRSKHFVSTDGSLAFFPTASCAGTPIRLYLRDIEAETTELISTAPISGPECDAHFIRSIAGAAFFYTHSRLAVDDSEPSSCGSGDERSYSLGSHGDVYRYDLGNGALKCLTCMGSSGDGGVIFSAAPMRISEQIGVAEDGSRIYFTSGRRLTPGAPATEGIYRLDVASGALAYIGRFGFLGDAVESAMNPDGSVVVFKSASSDLNALGGQQNGANFQLYRYDDRDRSLVCISCPPDGSVPAAEAGGIHVKLGAGANVGPLSRDGNDLAFATPLALVGADQNTAGPGQNPAAGTDVYEWRDGRLLLVSDGLTNWPDSGPEVSGITPSGHDIFFTEAAQLTHDALDGYRRLYDARIGGGFEFPPPPKPCPLEVCQGTPKGAPEEAAPGTATIAGVGNAAAQKSKSKKKHQKKRHKKHAKKTHHKANSNRGAAR
jgi:hypothetical protein